MAQAFAGGPGELDPLPFLAEEMLGNFNDVIATIPQWRYLDGYHRQAEIKILAELAILDSLFQVPVARRQDPDINLDLRLASNSVEFPFLQGAQDLHLHVNRHIPNFIQKKSAAIGELEFTGGRAICPGEGSLLVAEEFTFNQVWRYGTAVYSHKGLVLLFRLLMDLEGNELLAGAVLAGD